MTLWSSLPWTKSLFTKQVWDARSLVEVAAWLSCHSAEWLEQFEAIPERSMREYWTATRGRWEGWMQALKAYLSQAAYVSAPEWAELWKHTRAVAAEALASEPLTRMWGALVAAGEAEQGESLSDSVTRCVLSNHTAAVDYVMNLLEQAPRVPQEEAAELTQLHYHSRRWSDLLLAPLVDRCAVEPFAVDAQRSAEYYATYFTSQTRPEVFWRLFATSVRLFFQHYALDAAPSTNANHEVVRCILDSLPTGLLRSEAAALKQQPHRLCTGPQNGPGRLTGLV
jgi:hypothetical protein